MGGCKCTFQDCGLTTTSSKKSFPERETHFFHFPARDPERCIEWAIYSNNMDFLELPRNKILNKVICDFHFKENNFMNYKRERLTKMNSVPTIYISPDKLEIDLLQQPTEWVKANKAKKIPPLFSISSNINLNSSVSADSDTVDSLMSSPSPKKMKTESPIKTSSVRILNGQSSSNSDISVQRVLKKNLPTVSGGCAAKVMKVSGENYRIQIQNKSVSKNNSEEDNIQFTPTGQDVFEAATTSVMKEISFNDSSTEDLKPMLLDSLKQISEIKELLNEKQSEIASPSAPVSSQRNTEECTNISRSQFNKVQLFNGIKRYLSPSLIALLRMELFATPGREYKKDEKIICQELLSLGDKVYNFFTDEWRIRLPAKKDVKVWHDEQLVDEDDDAS